MHAIRTSVAVPDSVLLGYPIKKTGSGSLVIFIFEFHEMLFIC